MRLIRAARALYLIDLESQAVHKTIDWNTQGGRYVTGLKTGGMLLYNGKLVQMSVELPPGT